MKIYEIAKIIKEDWKNINYAAKPYLEAMFALKDLSSVYCSDDASSIILYFLSNATSWRGDKAKEIKKLLRDMIK